MPCDAGDGASGLGDRALSSTMQGPEADCEWSRKRRRLAQKRTQAVTRVYMALFHPSLPPTASSRVVATPAPREPAITTPGAGVHLPGGRTKAQRPAAAAQRLEGADACAATAKPVANVEAAAAAPSAAEPKLDPAALQSQNKQLVQEARQARNEARQARKVAHAADRTILDLQNRLSKADTEQPNGVARAAATSGPTVGDAHGGGLSHTTLPHGAPGVTENSPQEQVRQLTQELREAKKKEGAAQKAIGALQKKCAAAEDAASAKDHRLVQMTDCAKVYEARCGELRASNKALMLDRARELDATWKGWCWGKPTDGPSSAWKRIHEIDAEAGWLYTLPHQSEEFGVWRSKFKTGISSARSMRSVKVVDIYRIQSPRFFSAYAWNMVRRPDHVSELQGAEVEYACACTGQNAR
jgi:hypothetical protein